MRNFTSCDGWSHSGLGDQIEAIPDIAGTGVLISFVVSAWMTTGLVVVNYVVNHTHVHNPVDRIFVMWIYNFLSKIVPSPLKRILPSPSIAWIRAIEDGLLSYCDMQLITSLVILICGFSQLSKGLDMYHWQTIVYLASLSSTTHLAALTGTRYALQQSTGKTVVRLLFMWTLLALLAVALWPLRYHVDDNSPATCLYTQASSIPQRKYKDSMDPRLRSVGVQPNNVFFIVSLIFLVTGFTTRSCRLFKLTNRFDVRYPRAFPTETRVPDLDFHATQTTLEPQTYTRRLIYFRYIWIMRAICIDIWASTLFEIVWLCFVLIWGSLSLLVLRMNAVDEVMITTDAESMWDFGQLLPVCLLAAPVWSMIASMHKIIVASSRTATASLPYALDDDDTRVDGPFDKPVSTTDRDIHHALGLYSCRWQKQVLVLLLEAMICIAALLLLVFPAAGLAGLNTHLGFSAIRDAWVICSLLMMAICSLTQTALYIHICLLLDKRQEICGLDRSQKLLTAARKSMFFCLLIIQPSMAALGGFSLSDEMALDNPEYNVNFLGILAIFTMAVVFHLCVNIFHWMMLRRMRYSEAAAIVSRASAHVLHTE